MSKMMPVFIRRVALPLCLMLLLPLLTAAMSQGEDEGTSDARPEDKFYNPYDDPEELKRFLSGEVSVLRQAVAMLVVIFLLFTFVGVLCGTLCFCLERTCCVGKGLFRAGRALVFGVWWGIVRFVLCLRFCVCCGRGSGRKSAHERSKERKELRKRGQCAERINFSADAKDDRSAANFCPGVRVTSVNGANIEAMSPFCSEHTEKMRRRHSTDTVAFERDKYTWNLRYRAQFTVVDRELSAEVKQAIARQRKQQQKPGFIYMFLSLADTRNVPVPPADAESGNFYFYKIGMTTRSSAADRVSEWEDSVFDDREGVGWWRVKDALSAEQLIHALLINWRYARFNKDSSKFEIEWFYGNRKKLVETVERVVRVTNRGAFDELLAPKKKKLKK